MSFSVHLDETAACFHQSLSCFTTTGWFNAIIDWFNDVDWFNELRLVATAVLMAGLIVHVIIFLSLKYPNFPNLNRPGNWLEQFDLAQYVNIDAIIPQFLKPVKSQRRIHICPAPMPRPSPYDSTRRTMLSDLEVCIYAWPSKGGVIVLDHAEAVDLEFLGLDPLNPPAKRLPNQSDEDAFCQRLLLLGAKWWDSEARFQLLAEATDSNNMDYRALRALEERRSRLPACESDVGFRSLGRQWEGCGSRNLTLPSR